MEVLSHSEVRVLGRLPRLHQAVLAVACVAVFVGVGLWLGGLPVVPFSVVAGAVVGALAGVAVAWALVHDSHRRSAVPVRAVRRP